MTWTRTAVGGYIQMPKCFIAQSYYIDKRSGAGA